MAKKQNNPVKSLEDITDVETSTEQPIVADEVQDTDVKVGEVVPEETNIAGEELGVNGSDDIIVPEQLELDNSEEDKVSKEINGEEPEAVETEEDNSFLATYQEIQDVLANPEISIRDSIELISGSDNTAVKMLAVRLLEYNRKMGPNAPIPSDKDGAKNNYDLYIAIKNILSTEDETLHRIGMDIINLVFKEYSTEAFNEISLSRFDDSWTKSPTSLKSYQNIVTIISMLADKSTRKDALVNIDINKIRNDKVMDFSAKEVDRIINYYQA